jgi:hypothetical protein
LILIRAVECALFHYDNKHNVAIGVAFFNVTLNVVTLSVIMLNVIILSVTAPMIMSCLPKLSNYHSNFC